MEFYLGFVRLANRNMEKNLGCQAIAKFPLTALPLEFDATSQEPLYVLPHI
jgi:hypothetical protein